MEPVLFGLFPSAVFFLRLFPFPQFLRILWHSPHPLVNPCLRKKVFPGKAIQDSIEKKKGRTTLFPRGGMPGHETFGCDAHKTLAEVLSSKWLKSSQI
jgi:hypothetical protein